MAYNTLIAVERNFGKIDEVIVPGNIGNGYVDRRFPIANFDAAYAESLKGDWRTRIDIVQLRVHIEGDKPEGWSYASAKSRWNQEEGRYMIKSLYNSHGLYDYATLRGV